MINNSHGQAMPEPSTTKAALFFGAVFHPRLMRELISPAGLPENGMHMEGCRIDVVATYQRVGGSKEALVAHARERGMHLLVARMRPGHADDTVFELVYSQRGFTTLIEDLVLYTSGGTEYFLCPTRGDILYFQLINGGIEPQVSTPWSTRQERIAGFRDAAALLADAVGE